MTPSPIRALLRWLAIVGIPLAGALATSTACRDDDLPKCFNGSMKSGDRIAMHIVERVDSPARTADAAASTCVPSIGINVGDTIYATISTARAGNRCVGFAARLDAPSGLPSDLSPHSLGDSSDDNEIVGTEEFQYPCEGLISEDIRFEGIPLPITIPEHPAAAVAWINFYYAGSPADGSRVQDCPPSCIAGLHVSIEVVRGQDAQP